MIHVPGAPDAKYATPFAAKRSNVGQKNRFTPRNEVEVVPAAAAAIDPWSAPHRRLLRHIRGPIIAYSRSHRTDESPHPQSDRSPFQCLQ